MSFFTTVHIVTVEQLDQRLQSRVWYWDRTEAIDAYNAIVDQYEDTRIATVYSIDVHDTIDERVNTLMANRHSNTNRSPLEELRSNRTAPEPAVEYTPIMITTDGTALYTERTQSPDFWGYKLTKTFRNTWTGRGTDGERVGAVYLLQPEALLPEYQYERMVGNTVRQASFQSLQEATEALIEDYHKGPHS